MTAAMRAWLIRCLCVLIPVFYLLSAIAGDAPRSQGPAAILPLDIAMDIRLENIFYPEHASPHRDLAAGNNAGPGNLLPLKLVGTLVYETRQFAWIRIESSPVHELEPGQPVPGTSMKIGRIHPGFVEIINTAQCPVPDTCQSGTTLYINR